MAKSKRSGVEQAPENKKQRSEADFASSLEDGWTIGKNLKLLNR